VSHVANQPKVYSEGYFVAPPPRRRTTAKRILSTLLFVVIAGTIIWAVTNRQYIVDQFTVWTFHENATIKGYVDRSSMQGEGNFLFMASQPKVASAAQFNSLCVNQESGSGILGCYLPNSKTITLFDVTDPRLDGIEEVVAAHEMLHAAWDRMGQDEKDALTPQLEAAFETQKGNADLTSRMEYYARNEPGERLNELHSIIGTEVAALSPDLEKYYSQYFSNRQALVALHVKSNAVFVDLEAKSAALVSELNSLKSGIESDYSKYNSGYEKLNHDVDAFNTKAHNGGFTNQTEFNNERDALISRQQSLNALFVSIEARSKTYDQKVKELDSLNTIASQLNTSLNIVPHSGTGVDK
jgi:hypothetical protein